MSIVYIGIDLAKTVFAVHGVNEFGRAELVRPSVPRARLHELIATLPPCTIGMEACSGAHHWARLFIAAGHTVRLIAPKFVVPYRLSGKRGKNDAADAAAICEAVQRPSMRFVPLNSRPSSWCTGPAKDLLNSAPPPSIASEGCSASSGSSCP
jgi:transposase